MKGTPRRVTYHVGLRTQSAMLLKVAADFLDVPYPDGCGRHRAVAPRRVIEISCIAVLRQGTD